MTHKTSLLRKIFSVISKAIDKFEVSSQILSIAILAFILIANFLARTFYESIYFVEELTEFFVIFVSFVGLSYGVRKGRHIRMGAFLELMSPKIEKVFIIFISLVSSAVMFYMAYVSYKYFIFSIDRGHLTPALRVPYWVFYLIMPVGFFMAGAQYLRTVFVNFTREEVWISPEQQGEYETEVFTGE